ncbi:uncharacterized protein MEPE_04196 [Melanopsichium pennsylvanicum]|uniref:Uncharacterized protein n=1 Tax=Melanopsichium pennsylvanicum TaxID=63383 RepID=A0AAJ5C662_9BASI|nr:uncharacterized protein MEPE_04196 [Melanopsichium pennsylvanicum]
MWAKIKKTCLLISKAGGSHLHLLLQCNMYTNLANTSHTSSVISSALRNSSGSGKIYIGHSQGSRFKIFSEPKHN